MSRTNAHVATTSLIDVTRKHASCKWISRKKKIDSELLSIAAGLGPDAEAFETGWVMGFRAGRSEVREKKKKRRRK